MKLNLKHYSALAVAFIAMKSESDAQIVYTDIKDTTWRPDFLDTSKSYFLDLNGDGIADFQIIDRAYWTSGGDTIGWTYSVYITPLKGNEVAYTNSNADNINCGDEISKQLQWGNQEKMIFRYALGKICSSSAKDYCRTYTHKSGNWKLGDDGFCPVRLIDRGDTLYGWIRIEVTKPGKLVYSTIKDYAYEAIPDSSIEVGNVPCKAEKDSLPDLLTACSSKGVTIIDNGFPCPSYQWYRNGEMIQGATKKSYHADTSAEYFVVRNDHNSCIDTSNVSHVQILPNPEKPIITERNDTLFSSGGTLYQWFYSYYSTGIAPYNWFAPIYSVCNLQVKITDSNSCTNISDPYDFVKRNTIDTSLYYGAGYELIKINDTLTQCSNEVFLNTSGMFGYCVPTFQWVKNSLDIPGATGFVYNADSSGEYYCKLNIDGVNFQTDSAYVKLLSVPETPVISRIGDTLIASNEYSYQWKVVIFPYDYEISGAVNQEYFPTENGEYFVQATNSFGCSSFSTLFIFGSCDLENKSLNIPDSANLCNGESIILKTSQQSNEPSYSFQWFKNDSLIQQATDSTYSVNSPGKYYCEISGYNVVCNTDSVNISEYPIPTIAQKEDTLISSTGLHYQWQLNGVNINGATNREYVYRESGSYTVIVEVANICNLTSDPVQVVFTAVANLSKDEVPMVFYIKPKLLGVKFSGEEFLHGKIKIINALGQTVREVSIESNTMQIPFSEDESGWFVLDIEKDEHHYFSPVVIF